MEKEMQKLPAVILAAGQGKRLRPYTDKIPKVLVMIHGKPLLDYVLSGLIQVGIRDFFIVTGYKATLVENWIQHDFLSAAYVIFGNKINPITDPLTFHFIRQKEINGTGGATLLVEKSLKDLGFSSFLLTYGDLLVSKSVFLRLYHTYQQDHNPFYLVGNPTEDPSAGAAIYYEGDTILNFIEKPNSKAPKTDLNNSGIYIFDQIIFGLLKESKPTIRGEIELTEPIIRIIKEKYFTVKLIKMHENELWCDVGTIESLDKMKKNVFWLSQL